jgi:hypothetical protein
MTVSVSPADVVRETFNFSVDKFPLSGPDNLATPYYGLFKSDDSECLNVVSDRYYTHTTDDVVALVEAAQLAFDDDCSVRVWWNKGHHVIVVPSRDYRISVFGTKDNIYPRFVLNAGYNDTPVDAMLGMFRDACSNLSIPRLISGSSTKIKHLQSMRPRMDELIRTFQTLKDGWKTVTEVVAHMQEQQTSLVSFLDAVYVLKPDAAKRSITAHENRTMAIFNRLRTERFQTGRPPIGSDHRVSVFEAYQAVQGYSQHVQFKKKSQYNQILSASNNTEVLKAESLAMRLIA